MAAEKYKGNSATIEYNSVGAVNLDRHLSCTTRGIVGLSSHLSCTTRGIVVWVDVLSSQLTQLTIHSVTERNANRRSIAATRGHSRRISLPTFEVLIETRTAIMAGDSFVAVTHTHTRHRARSRMALCMQSVTHET